MISLFVILAVLCVSTNAFRLATNSRSYARLNMIGQTSGEPRSVAAVWGSTLKEMAGPMAAVAGVVSVASLAAPLKALAEEVATPAAPAAPKAVVPAADEKKELGPPPSDFGLKYVYYDDCSKVVTHMRYAVQLEKGNPILAEMAQKTKEEMNEFVAYYRRFQGISGKQSFSLLYTSINVLAGHYASYGLKFPVPEKRKKRLLQEFNDIEKNVRKKR